MCVIHYMCVLRYNLDQPYLHSYSNDTLVWVLNWVKWNPVPTTGLQCIIHWSDLLQSPVAALSIQAIKQINEFRYPHSANHCQKPSQPARQLTEATSFFVFPNNKIVFHLFSYSFYAVMLPLALIPSLSGLNAEEWKQSINNLFTPKRRHNGEKGKSPKAEGSSPAQAQRAGTDPTSKKQSRRVKQAGTGSGRLQAGERAGRPQTTKVK